jgi:hypothetical protein
MSRFASFGQQAVKGITKVAKEVARDAAGSAAKEGAVAFAREITADRPRVGVMEEVTMSSAPASPVTFSVAAPPRPPPTEFPALCVCKYEPDAPDLSDGNKQYICSSCSRSGMGEYRTVIEGRAFAAKAPLKGGKNKKTGKRRRSRRSRLHLTKRIRVRHNGRSRR